MIELKNREINLFIGLVSNDLKPIKKEHALNIISKLFIKNDISGFNASEIMGFWNNQKEKALLISFFNTFGLKYEKLINIIDIIKKELKQNAILLKVLNTPFEFI